MNVALALLLVTPLFNSYPAISFQEMLDSAQIVVIGKVDSMWYSIHSGQAWTNYSADILALYAKNDSLQLPKSSIHIALVGGEYPDGSFDEFPDEASFKIGEVFLAAVEENTTLSSEPDRIYRPFPYWKYTISNDSIRLYCTTYGVEPPSLSLGEIMNALSSHFTQKESE